MLRVIRHSSGTIYEAYPKELWERHRFFTQVGRVGYVVSLPAAIMLDYYAFKLQAMPIVEIFLGIPSMLAFNGAVNKYEDLGDRVPVKLPQDVQENESNDIVWLGSFVSEKN